MRRPAPRRRTPATRPATASPRPAGPEPAPAAPAAAAVSTENPQEETLSRRWQVIEWAGWIVLWMSAAGAGFFLGRIVIAKVVFMAFLLALTVLPWLRWIRPGSRYRIITTHRAMMQGGLAVFLAFVLLLSGTYVWAVALVVLEMGATIVNVVLHAPRPAQT